METCNCLEVLYYKLVSSSSTSVTKKPVEVTWPSLRHNFVFIHLSCGFPQAMGATLLCSSVPQPLQIVLSPRRRLVYLSVAPTLVPPFHVQTKLLYWSRERGTVDDSLWSPVGNRRPFDVKVLTTHYYIRSAVGSSGDVYTFALAGLPLLVQGSLRCNPEPPLAGTEY